MSGNESIFARMSEDDERDIQRVFAGWRHFFDFHGTHCDMCGNTGTWMGKPLDLVIHCKDGDFLNTDFDNLMMLCPNCRASLCETEKETGFTTAEMKTIRKIHAQAHKDGLSFVIHKMELPDTEKMRACVQHVIDASLSALD